MNTLLLNASYEPLHIISWKRAFRLLLKGRVEVLEFYLGEEVHTTTSHWGIPSVIRLYAYIPRKPMKVKFTRRNIYLRDNYQCQYCLKSCQEADLTFDHITPRSRGGKTGWENIVTCCRDCNKKKGSSMPQECGMLLLKKPVAPTTHSHFTPHQTTYPLSWCSYV